jgi:hypothetical protein
MLDFLKSCFSAVTGKSSLFVAMNPFYFDSVIAGTLLAQTDILPFYEWPLGSIMMPIAV